MSERERLGSWGLLTAVAAVLAVNAAFHAMWTRADPGAARQESPC